MSEIFKDVTGYEGLYEVSNEGNVKSLGNDKYRKEKILKPTANSSGYLQVCLYKDGNRKHHHVHRLVANAFIDNPDNLPQVNHKDERPTNNFVFVNEDGTVDYDKSNLEWCTCGYNINYGTHNQRVAEAKRGKPCPWATEALTNRPDQSIPIDMLTKDDELIRTFPSAHEAERYLRANGFPKAANTNIIQCCKGKPNFNTAYGFKWRYAKQKELPN